MSSYLKFLDALCGGSLCRYSLKEKKTKQRKTDLISGVDCLDSLNVNPGRFYPFVVQFLLFRQNWWWNEREVFKSATVPSVFASSSPSFFSPDRFSNLMVTHKYLTYINETTCVYFSWKSLLVFIFSGFLMICTEAHYCQKKK